MDKFQDLHIRATAIFEKCVVPIYLIDYRKVPKHTGSGFLVQVGMHYYVITAAHTLIPDKGSDDERSTPIIYVSTNRVLRLTNFAYSVPDQDGKNVFDVAVLRIPKDDVLGLPPYTEIDRHPMQLSRMRPNLMHRQGRTYALLGYPSSKNRVVFQKGKAFSTLMSYVDGSPPMSAYESLNLDPRAHLLVKFNDKADAYGQQPSPPEGLSGGPIFTYAPTSPTDWDNIDYGLVGVTTNHLPQQKLIKGVDIGAALHIIENYDRLSQEFGKKR